MLSANDPTYGADERRTTTDGGVVVAAPEAESTPAVPEADDRSVSETSSSPASSPSSSSSSSSRTDDGTVTPPVFDPPSAPRSEPLLAPHVDMSATTAPTPTAPPLVGPPVPTPGAPPLIGPPAPDELARPLGYPAPGPAGPGGPGGPLPGPGLPPRRDRQARQPRKRRVEGKRPVPEGRWIGHRLRHIGPWSVVKVAALFYFCLFLTFVVAIVLLWNVGRSTETIDQFEGFVTRLGAYGTCTPEGDLKPGTAFERDDDCPDGEVLIDGFKLQDATLFRVVFFGGVIIVVGGTLSTVLLTVLFNLLNDVTGGIRYTTIREPVGGSPPERSSRSPRHQARR
jgi:hypothetical protein